MHSIIMLFQFVYVCFCIYVCICTYMCTFVCGILDQIADWQEHFFFTSCDIQDLAMPSHCNGPNNRTTCIFSVKNSGGKSIVNASGRMCMFCDDKQLRTLCRTHPNVGRRSLRKLKGSPLRIAMSKCTDSVIEKTTPAHTLCIGNGSSPCKYGAGLAGGRCEVRNNIQCVFCDLQALGKRVICSKERSRLAWRMSRCVQEVREPWIELNIPFGLQQEFREAVEH